MGLIMDREQLGAAFGVSDSAISAWEKKGCPVLQRGRGRGGKSLYDYNAVRRWCEQTGHGLNLGALMRAEGPPAPASPPAPALPEIVPAPSEWGAKIAPALADAAICWAENVWDAGYKEAGLDPADLADLADQFLLRAADSLDEALGAGTGEALRAAVDVQRGRPETITEARRGLRQVWSRTTQVRT